LTASYAGVSETFGLTVNPPPAALSGVSVSPSTIVSGQSGSGTVSLTAAAPVGGAVVTLSSSNSSAVSVPTSISVAQGATSATFTVTAGSVITSTSVTLTASYSGVTSTFGITVNPVVTGPTAVSVTPSSGSGATQVFSFQFSDPNGYDNLSLVWVGFSNGPYDENVCRVVYAPRANNLYLENGPGVPLVGPVTLGISGTISTSQCTLDAGASSTSGSGNILTLNLAFTFTAALTGVQNIYMYAIDLSGLNTAGWQNLGTWIVP
jgi:hypothetical protein